MRCPACHAENARDVERCLNCNKAFPRKPARRRAAAEESDAPLSAATEERTAPPSVPTGSACSV